MILRWLHFKQFTLKKFKPFQLGPLSSVSETLVYHRSSLTHGSGVARNGDTQGGTLWCHPSCKKQQTIQRLKAGGQWRA